MCRKRRTGRVRDSLSVRLSVRPPVGVEWRDGPPARLPARLGAGEVKGTDLDRFTYAERVVHWVVGVTFVLLLTSGLAFSYPSLFWMTAVFGGGPAARALHPLIGLAFATGLAFMFVRWVRDMHLGDADVVWLKAVKHYARHEKDQVPPTGKYNGGQKIFFWAQSGFGLLFLFSGLPLWFPEAFGSTLLTTMRLVHYVAALGGGLLLIVHVYLGTVAYPGTLRGILYGRVSREWAKLHHPLWHKEKTGS